MVTMFYVVLGLSIAVLVGGALLLSKCRWRQNKKKIKDILKPTHHGSLLRQSLQTKKELSYYYAHSAGNKASDVDISKIGKGGYGIGSPTLLSSRSFESTEIESTEIVGHSNSILPRHEGAAKITNYAWEDKGKFAKIYVKLDPKSEPWIHKVYSTSTAVQLLLQGSTGSRWVLELPKLFGKVSSVKASFSKSGKRCIVKLLKEQMMCYLVGYAMEGLGGNTFESEGEMKVTIVQCTIQFAS